MAEPGSLDEVTLGGAGGEDYSLGSAEEASTTTASSTSSEPSKEEHHHHEASAPASHPVVEQAPPTAQRQSVEVAIPVLPLHSSVIEISILSGEKKGDGMSAFQTYHVKTKTTLPEFKKQEVQVERRFSDFIWLFENLQQNHRGVIIPPAPEKETLLIQDRFSTDFIEARRRELERFLKRVVSHPSLVSSKTLQTFLEASDSEFQAAKQPASTGGVWGSLFGASKKIANVFSSATEVDPWFDEKTKYLNNLETHLHQLTNTVVHTLRKYYELSFNYQEFGICSAVVAQTEAADKDLSVSFEKLGDVLNQIHTLQKELAQNEKDLFEDDIKDHHRLISAAKHALQYRVEKLAEYQSATKDFTSKKEKIQQLRDTGKPVTAAHEADLQKAEQLVNERKVIFETTSRNVRAELERFLKIKSKELQAALSNLIQANLTYELRVVDLWKKFLSSLPEESA